LPLRVLALRYDEYSHFDRKAEGRYISTVLFQPLLLTSPGGVWGTYQSDVRKHELARAVASLYIDMGRQPRWFAEGLATYLQTVSYDEASGVAEVGHAPANFEYLELLLQRAPDRVFFDDLWDWDRVEPTTEEQARLYQVS
jgi:hypothetical protein